MDDWSSGLGEATRIVSQVGKSGLAMPLLQVWRGGGGAHAASGALERVQGSVLSPLPRVDSSTVLLQSPRPCTLARTRKR